MNDLRARHPQLADRVGDGQIDLEAAIAEAIRRDGKPRSGYARQKSRMQKLYAEHNALKAEHDDLQASVDRLLAEHQRLMKSVKSPSWFEGANATLAQLEASPEPRALQVTAAALAQLQSRLSAIAMRVTL